MVGGLMSGCVELTGLNIAFRSSALSRSSKLVFGSAIRDRYVSIIALRCLASSRNSIFIFKTRIKILENQAIAITGRAIRLDAIRFNSPSLFFGSAPRYSSHLNMLTIANPPKIDNTAKNKLTKTKRDRYFFSSIVPIAALTEVLSGLQLLQKQLISRNPIASCLVGLRFQTLAKVLD
jgi:hypothetical protein